MRGRYLMLAVALVWIAFCLLVLWHMGPATCEINTPC